MQIGQVTPHPDWQGSGQKALANQTLQSHEPPALRLLLKTFLKDRKRLIWALLAGVISTLVTLSLPAAMGWLMDQYVVHQTGLSESVKRTYWVLIAWIALGVGAFWLSQRLSFQLIRGLTHQLREQGFKRLLDLPFRRLDEWGRGEILSRLTIDLEAVKEGLSTGILTAVVQIITLLGAWVALLRLHVGLGIWVALMTPVAVWVTGALAKRAQRDYQAQQQLLAQMNQVAREALEHAPLLQVLGREKGAIQHYQQLNAALQGCGQRAQFYASLSNPGARLVNHLIYLGVGLISALLAKRGLLSYGGIAAALSYTLAYAAPVNQASNLIGQLQKSLVAAQRVFAWINDQDTSAQPSAENPHQALQVTEGRITFESVTFGYDREKPLYQNFNLSLQPGQQVALVGPTGCGKTTLVQLLMQFYPLQQGRVLIDGQDLKSVTRQSLYQQVGMVLQDTWLSEATVAENIAYGRPEATRAEIEQAARDAQAEAFIRQLPNGYDTLLKGGGQGLSAGQRQLLTLARVFLIQPQILILDEATSQVDLQTEQSVQSALKKFMHGRTALIIAHRLVTIQHADLILYMEQGRVVESGTHAQLMAQAGAYARLYRSQMP